jgi:hypothetical protein
MKLFRYFILFSVFLSILAGCARDNPTINKALWSSRDPFNIPYKRRINAFMDGNKVVNPSFERGRYFKGTLKAYELTGWREVGEEIRWVNIGRPEYDSSEAKTGNHAIKIRRENVSEVEEKGVGIMSDYIKVFPGNYSLSYSIRLEDICPNKERLGSRLMDAINVRILYYDKNKIRIEGNTRVPGEETRFDNEFKALPFSGFWNIDSLGWIRARGISHKYPFSDGDLPDNIRYIRLFFGLKGKGTLWLDDVSFEFSEKNFTLLERLRRWQDSVFEPRDLLVPDVKFMSDPASFSLYDSDQPEKKPLILIPPNAHQLTLKASQLLQKKLNQGSEELESVPVVSSLSDYEENRSLVFSLGNNSINRKHGKELPFDAIQDKEQGYFIHRFKDKGNIIAVTGNTPIGDYYAVTTLVRLLDGEALAYNHANIIDYPDFTDRGVIFQKDSSYDESEIDFLTRSRFNRIYSDVTKGQNQKTRQDICRLGEKSSGSSLYQAGISLNPYRFTGEENPNYLLEQANNDMLRSLIQYGKNHSVNSIILRPDSAFGAKGNCSCFFEPNYDGDHVRYRNLLDVHSTMINRAWDWSGNEGRISFLPVWHHNRCIIRSHGRGEMYLEELSRKVPGKTEFLWNGPVKYPLLIGETETRYVQKRYKKSPVFLSKDINPLSNSGFIRHYPGKARMTSIFDHFALDLPDNFSKLTGSRFITTLDPGSRIGEIKTQSLADYLWNAKQFDPHYSLLKILIYEYGKITALNLIRFNEAYFGLYEMYWKIRTKETKRKYIRSAQDFKNQIDRLMATLRRTLKGKPLLAELESFKKKANEYFKHIQAQ